MVLGNCSLSTIYSDADDCADMFARVEALPWQIVHDAVKETKTWSTPAEYVKALDSLPLGANVAAFVGHSDIRAAVLGLGRSVDAGYRPTRAEIDQMQQMLSDALDAGFLGLSTLRSSFSKLEGTRYPARQLPSTYAKWSEFHALNNVLRRRGRVHQSTPNLARQAEVTRYLAAKHRPRIPATSEDHVDCGGRCQGRSAGGTTDLAGCRSQTGPAVTSVGSTCRCRSKCTPTVSISSFSRSSVRARPR